MSYQDPCPVHEDERTARECREATAARDVDRARALAVACVAVALAVTASAMHGCADSSAHASAEYWRGSAEALATCAERERP